MAAVMRTCGWLAALVALALVCARAHGAVFEGSVDGKSGPVYLGKFCFEYNNPGDGPSGKWSATVETATANVALALFDDEPDSWPTAYDNSACNCMCQLAAAKDYYMLAVTGTNPGGEEIVEHLRPRFWYAALISCDEPVTADYKITFEQADGSQVGVNDQGLYALFLVSFFVWGIGLAFQLYHTRWLWRGAKLHRVVKLFTVSLVLWWLFIVCLLIHWAVYDSNGVGVPFLQGLGDLLEVLARVTFLLVVMLIATGWTISTQVLEPGTRLSLLVSVGLVLVLYLVLAIWDLAGRNPATTTYVYDSAPGIIIAVMHVLLCGWFVWQIRKTLSNEVHTEKIRLYKRFGALYAAWFFLLPVVVLIGSVVAPWDRAKTVMSTLMCLNTIAVPILGYLLYSTTKDIIQSDDFVPNTQQYEDL